MRNVLKIFSFISILTHQISAAAGPEITLPEAHAQISLTFSKRYPFQSIIHAIERTPNLNTLTIKDIQLTEARVRELVSVLPCTLKTLKLINNHMGTNNAKLIIEFLRRPSSVVETVWLQGNKLEDESAADFADLLGVDCFLSALSLANNNISNTGFAKICESLRTNTILQALDLSSNCLTPDCADLFSTFAYMKTLISLSKLVGAKYAYPSPSEMAPTYHLKLLKLDGNDISEDDGITFADTQRYCQWSDQGNFKIKLDRTCALESYQQTLQDAPKTLPKKTAAQQKKKRQRTR